MDELDVKILRALISESAVAPTNIQMKSSLRSIARRLGADDMTVANRFKRLQEAGCMNEWKLSVNPSFLGYGMLDMMLDVDSECAKPDTIRKLRLIDSVVAIVDFLGKALKIVSLYNSEESRSRTIELVSRITRTERVVISRLALPSSDTENLTETDEAIIGALANDARKSSAEIAKEIGSSQRTVRNHIDRLRGQKTLFTFPNLNMTNIAGFIPVVLSYSYATADAKGTTDRAMLSHFDSSFLWGGFSDPEHAFIVLSAPTMADVPAFNDWAGDQPGVATARTDIPIRLFSFPEKLSGLLKVRRLEKIAI